MSDKKTTQLKAKEKNPLPQAHDHAFQAAMRDLRVARDFLQHHLPEVVRKQLDLNTLQMHPTTFVDPELRKLISDVLYSAQFHHQNHSAFLYVAVEHQSAPDPSMALRMIKYTCRILDHYTQEYSIKTPLPVVIPLVFYNGHQPYPYSCSVFDLFGEHQALAQQFMFHQFQLIDLNQIPDEELRQHQWSGLLELLFKHITTRDIMRYLEELNDIVDDLVQSKADDYLMTMIKYLIEKSEISDRNQFYQWVHRHLSSPLEEQTMTLAEQLRTEGMQQGMQQGKLEGEQILFIQLLHHRFPILRSDYENRIKSAGAEELLLWGKRIFSAKSVEEVFED